MSRKERFKRHMMRWGAIYIVLFLFLAALVGQFIFTVIEVGNEAAKQGEVFEMARVWPTFFSAMFENWQSEWLQLAFQGIFLLGFKHLLFRVEAEDIEEIQESQKKIIGLLEKKDDPAE